MQLDTGLIDGNLDLHLNVYCLIESTTMRKLSQVVSYLPTIFRFTVAD